MTFKKLTGQLHLWLGLASGLVVFIMGITGAAYVFVDEIRPVLYRDRLYVKPENKVALPLSQLKAIAEKALGDKGPVTRAEVFSQPDHTYMFRALKLNPEGLTYWDYYQYYFRVYVNPYNGKVVKVENTKYEFFNLVLGLHMRLFFGPKVGHFVVGYAVLMFVVLLISGLVLWWPRKWGKASREKGFRIKWNASGKRVNYDLHNVLGFYASVVLLVVALTGLVWVFEWMEKSVRFVANGGHAIEKSKPLLSDTTTLTVGTGLDYAFALAKIRNPDAFSYLVTFPAKKSATLNISAYQKSWNKYDRITENYDRYTGKLLRATPFGALNAGDQIYQLNFDMHTGSVLGLPGKILALCAGLIAASLPISGFLIWWGRRKKGRGKSKNSREKRPVAEKYRISQQ